MSQSSLSSLVRSILHLTLWLWLPPLTLLLAKSYSEVLMTYPFLKTIDYGILTLLRVSSYGKLVCTEVAVHSKLIDLSTQISIDMLLMSVVPDSLSNGVLALEAPHIEHHLKADLSIRRFTIKLVRSLPIVALSLRGLVL